MDVKFKLKGFEAKIKGEAGIKVDEVEIVYENFNLKEVPAIIKETRKVLREIADIEREATAPINPFGNFPTFVPGGAVDEDEDIEDEDEELDEDIEDEDLDEDEEIDEDDDSEEDELKEKPKKTPGRRSSKKSTSKKRKNPEEDDIEDENDATLDS